MKNVLMSQTMIKLVSILNDGQYHDGNSLGKALHVTRSAVWKSIKKLVAYGIQIDSIKSKGYALLEPLVLLDKLLIKKELKEKVRLDIFESMPSTNHYLKKFTHETGIRICIAEAQTEGKGRFNRDWHSPFGKNIYLSCLYPFKHDVSQLAGLSLVVGLAITEALKNYPLLKPLGIKWPNDIYYDHKKLAGILIDLQAETNSTCHAIIGIGLNINMLSAHHPDIKQTFSSLREMIGEYVDRNKLTVQLIHHLLSYLKQFEQKGLSFFMDEWKNLDYLKGRNITLKNRNRKLQGNVKGINEQGQLLIKLKQGEVEAFSSGDVSILKK